MTLLLLSATLAMAFNPPPGVGSPTLQDKSQQATAQEKERARKEGITPAEMSPWLASTRNRAPQSGFDLRTPLLTPQQLSALGSPTSPVCANGGFELGTFANWHMYQGSFAGVGALTLAATTPPAPTATTQLSSRHTILPVTSWSPNGSFTPKTSYTAATAPPGWNGPYDPIVSLAGASSGNGQDLPLPFPGGQAHTLRLGNPMNGSGAEAAVMTFTVPPTMTDFTFQYGMVLEDPGHDADHQPRLIYQLYDMTAGNMVDSFQRVASQTDPFFKTGMVPGGHIVWRRVSCQRIPIASRVGHQLVAIFVNTDCGFGGHFGYSYIDSLCDQSLGKPILNLPEKICVDKDLQADGSQSVGVITYSWTVTQCDQNGNNEVPSTSVIVNGTGPITGLFDVTRETVDHRRPLVCGHYYKVKLKVETECAQIDAVSKIVYVDCCAPAEECCRDIRIGRDNSLRPTARAGTYALNLQLTGLPGGVRSIDFDIASSSQANTGTSCPPGGPVFGYVSNAAAISGLNFGGPTYPANPYSHCVDWLSPGTTAASSPVLPVTLTFPTAPRSCVNFLRFCVKISVKTEGCRSCEIYQWFYYRRTANAAGRETIDPIRADQWPSGIRDREEGGDSR
ncbi:hypothetical protein [Fimbriimonas ginsengisoli]|uniref:CHU large protein n=1 Tax=Fimbriimonas ginsengisoli Gsoil 348 TaxID=661478 RepID=A0A068NY41_FIMGI|nr:hypothetical protein [Fimbriimonas ginsengisoli]AIE86619.1 CHU large protein [Fimbriimonas ginsengisoli Gsoil 348]